MKDSDNDISVMVDTFKKLEEGVVAESVIALADHYFAKGYRKGVNSGNSLKIVDAILSIIALSLIVWAAYKAGSMNLFG